MKKRIFIVISVLFVLSIILYLLLKFGESVLSKNRPVNANILIIEGWLPVDELELIPEYVNVPSYETVIITGLSYIKYEPKLHNSLFEKSRDIEIASGGACLKQNAIARVQNYDTVKSIKVYSHGTKALGRFPHFLIYINDSVVGAGYTTSEDKDPVVFKLNYPAGNFKKFLIYFDNDVENLDADRNLYIDSVTINRQSFAGSNYFARMDDFDANSYINVKSESQRTANFLKYLGLNKPFRILDTMYLGRNRTRAFAVKCTRWIDKTYKGKPYSINIVSLDLHSKRTYYTYKSLEKQKEIGIISLPYTEDIKFVKGSALNAKIYILKEYVSLLLNFLF